MKKAPWMPSLAPKLTPSALKRAQPAVGELRLHMVMQGRRVQAKLLALCIPMPLLTPQGQVSSSA